MNARPLMWIASTEAINWANSTGYGNGEVIFTKDGGTARYFKQNIQCGMVGVNVGVPEPMAAFSGWNVLSSKICTCRVRKEFSSALARR